MTRIKDVWGYILFLETITLVFFVGLLPQAWHSNCYSIVFILLFFSSVLNLDKYRKTMIIVAIAAFVLEGVASINDMLLLSGLSKLFNALFFAVIVGFFIHQIYKAQNVNGKVILEAVTGYLLLGLVFVLLLTITASIDPNSYNFSLSGDFKMADGIYYGYVTLSTLGYGDLLPLTPFSKSLALLNTISGQLYLAIIIALLVGKFSSTSDKPGE